MAASIKRGRLRAHGMRTRACIVDAARRYFWSAAGSTSRCLDGPVR